MEKHAYKMVSDLHLFTVRDSAKGFLISLRASGRYKETYLSALSDALAYLGDFADENDWPGVAGITTAHIEEYLVYLRFRPKWFGARKEGKGGPVSQAYFESHYRRLKRFFNWLKERDFCEKNPLDLIPHPKIDERIVPTVSTRELQALIDMVDPKKIHHPSHKWRAIRNRAALFCFIDTPARLSEITGLTVDNVDFDEQTLRVMGKGGRERIMFLGATALESLWTYAKARSEVDAKSEGFWVDYNGKAMGPAWFYLMVKRLGKRAGMPKLHPHQFRHTFAVEWIRQGGSERLLMVQGGWRKIPDTYMRTLSERDAAAMHAELSPGDRLRSSKTNRKT